MAKITILQTAEKKKTSQNNNNASNKITTSKATQTSQASQTTQTKTTSQPKTSENFFTAFKNLLTGKKSENTSSSSNTSSKKTTITPISGARSNTGYNSSGTATKGNTKITYKNNGGEGKTQTLTSISPVSGVNSSSSSYGSGTNSNSVNIQAQERSQKAEAKAQNQANIKNRNNFNNDSDYESYVIENAINPSKGSAKSYLSQKAKETGVDENSYLKTMRSNYRRNQKVQEYEDELANKKQAYEQRKANDEDYDLDLIKYSNANGDSITGRDYKQKATDINARYQQLVNDYETTGNASEFNKNYQSLMNELDDLQNYTSSGYNDSYDEKIKENNKLIHQLTMQRNSVGLDESQQEQLDSLIAENENLQTKADDVKTLQDSSYYEQVMNSGDKEAIENLKEEVSHYHDNVVERLGNAMVSSVIQIGATAVRTLSALTDASLKVEASLMEIDPNNLSKNDDDYQKVLDASNSIKKYANEVLTNPIREKLDEETSRLNTYVTAGIDNPVEKFIYDGLASTGSFYIQLNFLGAFGSLLSMSAQSGSERYYELINEVDENGNQKYTQGQILANSVFTGLASYGTEKIGMDKFVELVSGEAGRYLAGHALNYVLKSTAQQAIAEGSEEVVEEIADRVINKITGVTNEDFNADDLMYSFAVGAFSGGLMGIKENVGNILQIKARTNEQYNALNTFENKLNELKTQTNNPELLASINNAINSAEFAKSNFKNESVLGNAVVQETSDATITSNEEAMQTLSESLVPNVEETLDLNNQINQSIEGIDFVTQQILNDKGVKMNVHEYESLNKDGRAQVDKISQYAEKLGINVAFSTQLGSQIQGVNVDGNILINPLSPTPQTNVLAHEITHNLEQTKSYKNLVEILKDSGEYGSIYKNVAKQYNGIDGADIDSEAVAKYIENNMDDIDVVKRLIAYDNGLASRVVQWIGDMFDSNEKTKIANVWRDAFNEYAQSNNSQTQMAYSINTDSDGNELSEEERKADLDEMAVRNGYKKAYHGTNAEFNTIDSSKTVNGKKLGNGFYLTDYKHIAQDYGKVKNFYYKLDNPFVVSEELNDANTVLDKYLPNKWQNRELGLDYVDGKVNSGYGWLDLLTLIAQENGYGYDFAKYLQDNGYDGLVTPDGFQTVVYPNEKGEYPNVKSAEPFTYDDNGNLIPLEQRFNKDTNDIRYSLVDETEEQINGKCQKFEDVRQQISNIINTVGEYNFSWENIKSNPKLLSEIESLQETLNSWGTSIDDYANDEQRQMIDNGVVDYYYQDLASKGVKGKTAFIVIGPPASGKSSVIVKSLKINFGALEVDADKIKEMLPEYREYGGAMANYLHEESSELAKKVQNMLEDGGYNIALPLVGKNTDKINNLIDELKAKGYGNIELYDINLPTDKTKGRAMSRFVEEGRYLSPEYLESVGDKPTITYEKLKNKEGVTYYARYNNDVNRGAEAILLESGGERYGEPGNNSFEKESGKANQSWQGNNGGQVRRGESILLQNQIDENATESGFLNAKDVGTVNGEYQNLQNKYGVLDATDNYNGTRRAPQSSDYGKTHQGFRTIIENEQIVDSNRYQQLKSEFINGSYVYEEQHNAPRLAEAKQRLEQQGLDKSYDNFMNSQVYEKKAIMNKYFDGIAIAMEMLNKNDTRVGNVLQEIMEFQQVGADITQASRLLKYTTPEYHWQLIEKQLNKLQSEANKKWGNKAPTLQINEQLQEEFNNANSFEEREEIGKKIKNDLQNQIPPTLLEQLNSWRYMAMLSAPTTHIRNIAGNAIMYTMASVKDAVGAGIEYIAQKLAEAKGEGFERTKTIFNPFSKKGKKALRIADEAFDNIQTLMEGEKYEHKAFNKNLKILNAGNGFISGTLNGEDFFASKANFRRTYAEYILANHLDLDNLNEVAKIRAQEYSILEAKKDTFRQFSRFAKRLNEISRDGGVPAWFIDTMLPFKQTPINVLKRGVEYSPIGLISTITKGSADLSKGKITTTQFIDSLASGLSGTGIAMLGYLLASVGIFRTKDDDKDRKQAFDEANGEQDYSINVGNASYTIDWLTPFIIPLSIGAEVYNTVKDLENLEDFNVAEVAYNALVKVADPIIETTMLSNVSSALKSYANSEGERFGQLVSSAVTNYVSSYIPAVASKIAKTVDDTQRSTYSDKFGGKTWKKILNKIPFASKTNEASIDIYGQEKKNVGGTFFGRLAYNMLSPGYYANKEMDSTDEELLRLYESTGETKVFPTSAKKTVTNEGQSYTFTDKEYTAYQKSSWSLQDQYIKEFINDEEYNNYTDEEKASIIDKIRSYAGEVAKDEFFKNRDIEYSNKTVESVGEALENEVSVSDYFITKDAYSNMSGDTKKGDYIDYLKDDNMSDKAKLYMYSQEYGDSKAYGYVSDMDWDDKTKLSVFEIMADTVSDVDANGKTVSNSKAKKIRAQYEELGVWDSIYEYVTSHDDVEWSSFGLTKTVALGKTSTKSSKKSSSKKSSSKKASTADTGESAIKGTISFKANKSTYSGGSGSSGTSTASNSNSSNINLRNFTGANTVLNSNARGEISQNGNGTIDDDYLEAYSKIFRRSLV